MAHAKSSLADLPLPTLPRYLLRQDFGGQASEKRIETEERETIASLGRRMRKAKAAKIVMNYPPSPTLLRYLLRQDFGGQESYEGQWAMEDRRVKSGKR